MGLTILPDSIGNLTNLTELYVRKNQLTTLPDSIGNLTNLQVLGVENNQLTTLPDWIGNLTHLEYLYVDNNQLTTLPDSIGNLTNLTKLNVEDNENLTINRSLLNRIEDNNGSIETDDDVTIIEDGQGNVPEAPVSTPSPSVPAPIQPSLSTPQPVQPSNNQIKQEVLEINQYVNAFPKNMYSNVTIDINTTISFSDPITLDDFNGTIKEYIHENISNVVFAAKETNGSMLYFLTNREIIQRVLNESGNILYPCIETGTLRSENIEKDMKLLNLRSLGFHTSLQYCFMNVYEKLPQQLQVFVIENTGLTYPSYVSDDVLNQSGSALGGSHCQGGYEEDKISVLRIPQEIIDSTPQQGGKKKRKGKGKKKTRKGKGKTKKGKGKGKTKKGKRKHMKKGKKKTRKGKKYTK
jgi:Leucine-rich repeat (LRR) protein